MKLLFRSFLLFIFASSYLFSFQTNHEDIDFKRYSKAPIVQHSSPKTQINEFVKHNSQVSIKPISTKANVVADVTDSLTLVAIYNEMGGEEFWTIKTNWLTDAPLSTWYGITLNENGKVSEILLDENNITSTIPSELGNLTELVYLSLWDNKLNGSIPKELGKLIKLRELYLGVNQLIGEIPREFSQLEDIETLNLRFNLLSGEIPKELGSLGKLKHFLFDQNQLSGIIPSEMGNLQSLTDLSIANNQLSGSLPPSLGNLESLTGINISNSNLTGPIPKELGNLTELTVLNLSGNLLNGEIPTELSKLSKLRELYLVVNQLSGSIPKELGSLKELIILALDNNRLEGSIPKELGNLDSLQFLTLNLNLLSGTVPEELGKLQLLNTLFIRNNNLEGEIPESFLELKNLKNFSIRHNKFDSGLGNLPVDKLDSIWIYDNKFDFGDLIKANYSASFYLYAPQDSLGQPEVIILEEGKEYIITSSTEHVDGNIYKWFKDGKEIEEQTSTDLIITDAQKADYGVYTCTVTNEIAPLLTLYRATVSLTSGNTASVNPFIEITNEFKVYPNPARDFVAIEFRDPKSKGSIQVLDLLGSEVMSLEVSNERLVNIDVSQLVNGYYNVVINSGDKNYFQPLFINK